MEQLEWLALAEQLDCQELMEPRGQQAQAVARLVLPEPQETMARLEPAELQESMGQRDRLELLV
jgi:hypothetical protein